MEASLLSALMAIYSAGLKVSRFIHQDELDNYHVFAGGDQDLLLIPVNAAYALLLAGKDLATSKKVLETVAAMLAVRDEVEKALKHMGVAPLVKDDEESAAEEDTTAQVSEADQGVETMLKKKKKIPTDELRAYWDEAVEKQTSLPTNPDVISYEQARQLGLAPGGEA
jgi:hypothetical protein